MPVEIAALAIAATLVINLGIELSYRWSPHRLGNIRGAVCRATSVWTWVRACFDNYTAVGRQWMPARPAASAFNQPHVGPCLKGVCDTGQLALRRRLRNGFGGLERRTTSAVDGGSALFAVYVMSCSCLLASWAATGSSLLPGTRTLDASKQLIAGCLDVDGTHGLVPAWATQPAGVSTLPARSYASGNRLDRKPQPASRHYRLAPRPRPVWTRLVEI